VSCQQEFKRNLASLENIFAFMEKCLLASEIEQSDVFALNFAVEELFTNVVKYNLESKADILLRLEQKGREIKLEIIDPDAEPFDVTQMPEVNTRQPLEKRQIGGLGLHLVKKMVDKIDYNYQNRQSKITITKKLSS